MENINYGSLEEFLNESKKKPTTKEGKEKKLDKVFKEFGKGELKPFHADKPLKSKKQGGTEEERKQAIAIALSSAGLSKKKKKKKHVKESLNEELSGFITIEELVDWVNNDYALCFEDEDKECKKESIINFIDKQGVTLEELNDTLTEYHDDVDHFTKGLIDDILIMLELEFDMSESFNEAISYDKFDYEQELYHEIKGIIEDSWSTKLDKGEIGNVLIKLGKHILQEM